jgi:hypothetical protein
MSKQQPKDIVEASAAVTSLPDEAAVAISSGERVAVRRLSWLQFEVAWADLAILLSALLAAGEDAPAEELLAQLTGAPAVVLKLASLSSGLSETELAQWHFADVLSVAAAAIQLNFVDSAGVRGFFSALGKLTQGASA